MSCSESTVVVTGEFADDNDVLLSHDSADKVVSYPADRHYYLCEIKT
jgi:hypothetical protein